MTCSGTPTRLDISKKCGYSLKISVTVGLSFDIHDLHLVYVFSVADLIEGMFSGKGLSCLMNIIHCCPLGPVLILVQCCSLSCVLCTSADLLPGFGGCYAVSFPRIQNVTKDHKNVPKITKAKTIKLFQEY